MQSVPITTEVVSSNPAHVEVYSIQHYLIKFVITEFSYHIVDVIDAYFHYCIKVVTKVYY